MSEGTKATPKAAASVILLRESPAGPEVYLLRRHRKASFMSSSYVFPGGIALDDEDSQVTAGRELFEESGVLISETDTTAEDRVRWREALNKDKRDFEETLGDVGVAVDSLTYFAHWVTPSIEPRRYSAIFYVAVMPQGQTASPDNDETVDEVWVTPAQALERSDELRLPPPQLRTFFELLEPAKHGVDGILAAARTRQKHRHAILPRALATDSGLALLLPWDPDYETTGQGEALPIAQPHELAYGPSRVVLNDGVWSLQEKP